MAVMWVPKLWENFKEKEKNKYRKRNNLGGLRTT